jgi:predicted component of type VI protein secretion system
MERVDGGFILRDQDSTNGIKQGKSLMQIIDLKDGMEISIGDVMLNFQLSEEEAKTLSDEHFVPHQLEKSLTSSSEDEAPKKSPPALKESKSKPPAKKQPEPVENAEPASLDTPPPSPAAPSYNNPPAMHSGGNAAKPLLVFILIITAIFTGMSVSHKMRTGKSLPSKLVDTLKRKPVVEKADQLEDSSDSSEADGK